MLFHVSLGLHLIVAHLARHNQVSAPEMLEFVMHLKQRIKQLPSLQILQDSKDTEKCGEFKLRKLVINGHYTMPFQNFLQSP